MVATPRKKKKVRVEEFDFKPGHIITYGSGSGPSGMFYKEWMVERKTRSSTDDFVDKWLEENKENS